MGDRFPTADQVATAIVAACRETGRLTGDSDVQANALALARGERDAFRSKDAGFPISRARIYAALALDDIFGCGGTAIARMVGVGPNASKGTLLPTARSNIENNALRWYDPAALGRVKAAVRACPTGPAPPQPPGGTPQPAPAGPQARPVSIVTRTQQHRRGCPDCGSTSDAHAITCRWRPTVAARARQVERAIEAPGRFAGQGAQEYVPASSGKRALQEMLANAAAETARQQARQRRE
jgi:hypothetical protein